MLSGYYYDRLDERQKIAYRTVCSGIAGMQPSVRVNHAFSGEEARQIMYAVQRENPEFYHCIFQLVLYRGAPSPCFEFEYLNADAAAYGERLSRLQGLVAERLGGRRSEYDVCVAVHDVLAEWVSPDDESADLVAQADAAGADTQARAAVARQIIESGAAAAFSAYGAVVNGRAVCMGIAAAAKLLLNSYGVSNALVGGVGPGNSAHMWNVVEIGGERYNLDITSDLPLPNFNFVRYNGCLLPDRIYSRTFVADTQLGCNGMKDSYFVRNRAYCRDLQGVVDFLEQVNFSKPRGTICFLYEGGLSEDYINAYVSKIFSARLRGYCVSVLGASAGVFQCGAERR